MVKRPRRASVLQDRGDLAGARSHFERELAILEKTFDPEHPDTSINNKSHSVTAEIDVPQSGAEGVIIAQGANIGGWSLYAKGGKLKYCYNLGGIEHFFVEAESPLPPGRHQVRMKFAYAGGGLGEGGQVTLFTDGKKVGEGDVARIMAMTLAMVFSADGGYDVGEDSGVPVSPDYGPQGNAFNGRVRGVHLEITDAAENLDHLVSPEEAIAEALSQKKALPEELWSESTSTVARSGLGGHNTEVMPSPVRTGDATLEQMKSVIGGAIKKLSFAVVAKMIVEAASPDDCVLLADMAARARKEAANAQTTAPPPKMSEAELATFREFASKPENIWDGKDPERMNPAAFIEEKFADFLTTGGLWLEHFRAVPAQRKLAEAYYKEIQRHPERALNIYIQPHSLPVGAERAASAKLVAERTEEERAAVQAKNTLSKQASRAKSKILPSSCP